MSTTQDRSLKFSPEHGNNAILPSLRRCYCSYQKPVSSFVPPVSKFRLGDVTPVKIVFLRRQKPKWLETTCLISSQLLGMNLVTFSNFFLPSWTLHIVGPHTLALFSLLGPTLRGRLVHHHVVLINLAVFGFLFYSVTESVPKKFPALTFWLF